MARDPVARDKSERDYSRRSPEVRRNRSPEGRRSKRSRSRSPLNRTKNRTNGRERRDRDRRDRSYDKRHSSPSRKHDKKHKRTEKIDLESCQGVDNDMMKAMGFGNFDSTKNKKVADNVSGAVKINKPRKYRQYMNRKGGFNRPLDYVA